MNSACLSNSSPPQEDGFTLLEVLIAMAILVFISFSIYQATVETFRLRDTLSAEGNFYSSIRLATSIVERDIALLYSPTVTILDTIQKDPNSPVNAEETRILLSDDLAQGTPFWSPAVQSNGIRPAHFVGTADKLTFVSLSHVRIYKDSPEAEFANITYELKKDDDNPEAFILVKTETPASFVGAEFRDTFVHSYPLLRGIKKLTYNYYQRDSNTWKVLKSWDTEKEENKNIYPDIIEMNFEVVGPKRLSFEGKFKFRPEIPLNGLSPSI